MPITPDVIDHFAQALGPKGFTHDESEMAPWLSDWRGIYHGKAAAMLSPRTTAELREASEQAKQLSNERRLTAIEALRRFVSLDLTHYNWPELRTELYFTVGRVVEEADAADDIALEIDLEIERRRMSNGD